MTATSAARRRANDGEAGHAGKDQAVASGHGWSRGWGRWRAGDAPRPVVQAAGRGAAGIIAGDERSGDAASGYDGNGDTRGERAS
jgi:hypothetical protein